MQKCGGQILFTSKSVGKTWRLKTPAKMCCTFLGKSAGEAGRVFAALPHNLKVIQSVVDITEDMLRHGAKMQKIQFLKT